MYISTISKQMQMY